ncbi:MAG: FG-GAP repeat domain-containing protein, partial [Pyrinomonadaceae bacterium]
MSVPRPHRRVSLLLSTPLLFLLLAGLAFSLARVATGAHARGSNLIFNATLGNYTDTTVQLDANTVVKPDAAPLDTTNLTVSTSTNFKGRLEGDPLTGNVRVTNAHPAGTYAVAVRAFSSNTGTTDTKTFFLKVQTPSTTCNPATFQSATLAAGDTPSASVVGDFNGDGKQDIATANSGTNNVTVRLGDGAGGFGSATTLAVGSQPRALALGDFDGDGKQDLAVANSGSNNVSVRFGNGTGGFTAGPNVSVVGTSPMSVAVGDFNNDGRQDLVTADFGTNDATVLFGNGSGAFPTVISPVMGGQPRAVAVADFNNDGIQDIVTANNGSNDITIRLGDGVSFGAATNFSAGSKPESVVVADFNGDGKQDVATANSGTNNVSILIGDGTGAVVFFNPVTVGASPFSVAVGDFDGDGKQDLAVANSGTNNVSITSGDGAGGFGAVTNFVAGTTPRSVAVADFNGDGKQDIATANSGSADATILVRVCPAAPNTFVVSNTNDSGAGSLRQAILDANATPGMQTIVFQILGAGVHTISPVSALPDITDRVIIDGFTQPGSTGTHAVEINGAGAGAVTAGLNVVSGGSTIQGLAINNFTGHGIRLGTAGGNIVRGDLIGTNAAGNAAQANTGHGVFVDNTPNNTIGGAGAGDGNIISGSGGQGVRVDGPGAT